MSNERGGMFLSFLGLLITLASFFYKFGLTFGGKIFSLAGHSYLTLILGLIFLWLFLENHEDYKRERNALRELVKRRD